MTFASLFVPEELREAVSDAAWLEAMLEAELGLANAQARAGVVPAWAAAAIVGACRPELYDLDKLAAQGRAVGNPAEPLVRALRARVDGEAADWVHRGATSQDVVDSAAMLVARNALDLVLSDVDALAHALARLAERHRTTPMPARTLLQQALPTTFGLKAAGWLCGILDARAALRRVREERLAVQLGGAAGTLAALGEKALETVRLFAVELDLVEPELPWHTNRTRIAELASALQLAAGTAAKIALDVVLLAQSEVGEVAEARGGGSSTLPHKRNPAGSAVALACARGAGGHVSVLLGGLAQEHERAAGAWQAEWPALSGALALAGGAVASVRDVVEGLHVDAARMRSNLDASGGLLLAERLSLALAERHGRAAAHERLADAARSVAAGHGTLAELLAGELEPAELEAALDPETYLGAADELVERALARCRRELEEVPA